MDTLFPVTHSRMNIEPRESIQDSIIQDSIQVVATYSPDSEPIHMVANLEVGRIAVGALFLRTVDRPT